MSLRTITGAVIAVAAMTVAGAAPSQAATLDEVKAAGAIKCGVGTGTPGFAFTDDDGGRAGFNIAYCRALAAAVLGDADKISYVDVTSTSRFPALASGAVDVLLGSTTWTLTRDVDLGFTFAGVLYYDGQGFIGRKALGVSSATELAGVSICVRPGTTTILNLADFLRANDIPDESVKVVTSTHGPADYRAGHCEVLTADTSELAATMARLPDRAAHVIFPEIISKEPLGPLVRQDDAHWADIARWVLNALVGAEELGVTRANVREKAKGADNPEINRLLGGEGSMGAMLGLDSQWAVRAIEAEGNYGEIFDRHIGPNTALGLPRGLNALYKDGGILYSPPFR